MRCVSLWKCLAVCRSRWYTNPAVCRGLRNKNTLLEPVSQNCTPGHRCWMVMWVQMCLQCVCSTVTQIKFVKKSRAKGRRQRERKEETMKRRTACASGSSGTLTSESITDVFSSLSPTLPWLKTTDIPSPLFSSTHFSLSVSLGPLPSLYAPLSPISELPRLLAAQPQPLLYLYAVMRPGCVLKQTVVILHFLSHFPHFIFPFRAGFECQTDGQHYNSLLLYFSVTRSECFVEMSNVWTCLHMWEISMSKTLSQWHLYIYSMKGECMLCPCVCASLCRYAPHLVFHWPPGRGTAGWWGLWEWL